MTPDLQPERAYWAAHPGDALVGIDEAGRGCLAGPVVAAAVQIAEADLAPLAAGPLAQANDSKQLSPAQRDRLYETLTHEPRVRWGIGQASVEEIDRLNILRATHLAMRRAIEALPTLPDHALVDGLPVKGLPIPHDALVKGDSRSLLIACASILAKVTRDRLCLTLDAQFPGYGLAQHKGYGTRAHLDALRRLGPSPCHRSSFAPVRALQDDLPFPD